MLTIKVEVMQEDIKLAKLTKKRNPGELLCNICPIAQALKRQGDLMYPSVAYNVGGWIEGNLEKKFFTMPLEGVRFMDEFDRGEQVDPVSFTLTEITGIPIEDMNDI